MADKERGVRIAEVLKKAGWGQRKDESARMFRIFEKSPFDLEQPESLELPDQDLFDLEPPK